MVLLQSSYRHPFEYISPTLYIEKGSVADKEVTHRNTNMPQLAAEDNAFFFDNENEFDRITCLIQGDKPAWLNKDYEGNNTSLLNDS
jgi:hypothetical protein